MTREDFDEYCRGLPHTTHVVQWGNASVWKVGGKVFTVGGWNDDQGAFCVSFKTSDTSFEILSEQPGCRPAPYLASRGMKWIQRTGTDTLSDEDLKAYLAESHRLVAAGLTKKLQRELGLMESKS
ncbi:MmcQ/YjbR family DNA-binding protein [Hyphobacterium indicum]|uniref:MmcQ/YjbR family DNA-binding protein n=1 Tax=Hyphobacterium indicum TaxID=2162714 RepID=UPI000D659F39|nr:MmcQ/YjbR family DNA-binding protein [Hyphobacterium indicum]